jgi:hypothetical protein
MTNGNIHGDYPPVILVPIKEVQGAIVLPQPEKIGQVHP